jgi:hypothetical protein
MADMHALTVCPAVRFVLAAACLTLIVACVPRPASLASRPSQAGSASQTTGAGIGPSVPADTASTGPAGPTPIPSFVRPTPGPAPTFLAYTVKSGDTLTSIARVFHTTPRSVAFWSRIEHPSLDPESASYQPDRLEVGWILLLIPDAVFDEDQLLDVTPGPATNPPESAQPSGPPAPTAS